VRWGAGSTRLGRAANVALGLDLGWNDLVGR